MKRFILTALILFLSIGFVCAKNKQNILPSIKFDGSKYTLLYSTKSSETGGFLNEYYKTNQSYASWTELIGVHHYPTAFYPIEHAKEFADYLKDKGVVTSVEADEENNTALIYFAVMDKQKLPIIVEFNVFKYVKSPVCGTIGLQFAKRYRLNSPLEIEKVKKELKKTCLKYIKKVSKLEVPDLVDVAIDNGKYLYKEGGQNNLDNLN